MRIWMVLVVMTTILGGCSGPSQSVQSRDTPPVLTTERTAEGLTVRQSDLDGDGRADVFSYYRETPGRQGSTELLLVRKTLDFNQDGKPDVTQEYDAKGRLARESLDMDFDGRVDAVREYEEGQVVREELSYRFDGRFDVRKFYEKGVLVLKTVDTRRSGTFDEFQYFVGGQLTRIGWDRDGDGKPEAFEESPAAASQ